MKFYLSKYFLFAESIYIRKGSSNYYEFYILKIIKFNSINLIWNYRLNKYKHNLSITKLNKLRHRRLLVFFSNVHVETITLE